jgi:hypothetical protein
MASEDEELAWLRLREAILRCQAESAASEDGEPTGVSREAVRRLRDEFIRISEGRPELKIA